MATDGDLPKRQMTPIPVPVIPTSLPQKRALEDDHAPPISSPLNPNPNPNTDHKVAKTQSHDDLTAMARDKPARAKKESLKKRESKAGTAAATGGDSSRATPDPKTKDPSPSEFSPLRYKLAPPKLSDFDTARGPVFTYHHEVPVPDGSTIQFFETSEQ
jgi:COMPASS component BRE2